MTPIQWQSNARSPCLFTLMLVAGTAGASVSAVGPGAFAGPTTFVDFTLVANGTEVNGLMLDGLTFGYSLGNDKVSVSTSGPGPTNNVSSPNILSNFNVGVLSVKLPGPSSLFGYGYAVLGSAPLTTTTTISLFDGATLVGTLPYVGVPDPNFLGGYAGIQSTLPFDAVTLTFGEGAIAFALDNFRVTAVPEPATILLFAIGMATSFSRWSLLRRR